MLLHLFELFFLFHSDTHQQMNLRIHFHLNSEHRLENKQYPMEMHIVHKNTNLNDKDNENLVIGVLFDYNSEYDDNQFLNDINLAKEKEMKNLQF